MSSNEEILMIVDETWMKLSEKGLDAQFAQIDVLDNSTFQKS